MRDKDNLGITLEYNRNLYDNTKAKENFKDKKFKGKQLYKDPISEKKLHRTQKGAKGSFKQNFQYGTGETDHVVPIKTAHNRYKYNGLLSDKDLEVMVNRDYNYQILSKKLNTSKGSKSNIEMLKNNKDIITTRGQCTVIKNTIKAEVLLNSEMAIRTTKNAGSEFIKGSKESLTANAIPLAINVSQNVSRVVTGEITKEEAIEDFYNLSKNVVVAGGTSKVIKTTSKNLIEKYGNETIKKIYNSNYVTEILVFSLQIKDSVLKFVNNEITVDEMMNHLVKNANLFAVEEIGAFIGQAAIPIPVVGAIVGTMITTAVYEMLLEEAERDEVIAELKKESEGILREFEKDRELMLDLIAKDEDRWDKIRECFHMCLHDGIKNGSSEKILEGISVLENEIGESPAYKSKKDFDEKWFANSDTFDFNWE